MLGLERYLKENPDWTAEEFEAWRLSGQIAAFEALPTLLAERDRVLKDLATTEEMRQDTAKRLEMAAQLHQTAELRVARLQEALMMVAPAIAVLARTEEVAPTLRKDLLAGERLMLKALLESKAKP
jgi:hypothetical protein